MKSRRIAWAIVMALVAVAGGAWILAQTSVPTVNLPVASPPNIVFNVATPVTFTVSIPNPTLNPTTVTLQRVSDTGQILSTVGEMNDKGQSGDAVSGDKTFTLRVSLNEPTVGRVYFRAAAAFKGSDQNSWSVAMPFDVDPFTLPPDPGEAGKQTLEGIDSDNDGVRDDVQRWIGLTYQTRSSPVTAGLSQLAREQQNVISIASNSASLVSVASEMRVDALYCLAFRLSDDDPEVGLTRAYEVNTALKGVLLNTPERKSAFAASNRSLSGAVTVAKDSALWPSTCR